MFFEGWVELVGECVIVEYSIIWGLEIIIIVVVGGWFKGGWLNLGKCLVKAFGFGKDKYWAWFTWGLVIVSEWYFLWWCVEYNILYENYEFSFRA